MFSSISRRHAAVSLKEARRLSTSATLRTQLPNARVELDSSFEDFMKNGGSMSSWKAHRDRATINSGVTHRELEVFPEDPLAGDDYLTSEQLDDTEVADDKHTRKSPAARFGSQRFGSLVLPSELQETISKLITETDKPTLHIDAKRLFLDDSGSKPRWDTAYDVRYKTRRQAHEHAERDGTAFASVALPSHYSAIVAVLDHVKQRLGPEWTARNVIDWGSGTGSGLWAAAHVFQKPRTAEPPNEVAESQISNSTISTYVGLDKREGLVSIGRRLLDGVNVGDLDVTWKQAFKESHKVPYTEGNGVVAISAFMLSSLRSPLARKTLVTEMWESGAETIVIIDHSTPAGFECIAMARESLLRKGKKQRESAEEDDLSATGCHVVAPCPHDKACPLYHPGSTRLLCGFSQRLQSPEFVRKTKHSGHGHEDSGYSYVVIRRGARPSASEQLVGRVGDVGRRGLQKSVERDRPMVELTIDGEQHSTETPVADATEHQADALETGLQTPHSSREIAEALRSEAYHWPRLVYPPLKKSGHIVLDSCTAEGKIMRMTVPKSQGKQPFYDARKSSWGDIFPHAPKNRPQEKHSPPGGFAKDHDSAKLQDSSKRVKHDDRKHKSYSKLAEELYQKKRKLRQERLFIAKGELP